MFEYLLNLCSVFRVPLSLVPAVRAQPYTSKHHSNANCYSPVATAQDVAAGAGEWKTLSIPINWTPASFSAFLWSQRGQVGVDLSPLYRQVNTPPFLWYSSSKSSESTSGEYLKCS